MGKSTRRILGVVASIAVPFAAPVVAGALNVSSFLGQVAIGAGLGAGAAAIGGSDIGRGAMFGGLGTAVNVGLQNIAGANAVEGAQVGAGAGGAGAAPVGPVAGVGEAVSSQSLAGLGGELAAAGAPAAIAPGTGPVASQFLGTAAAPAAQAAVAPGTGILRPELLGTDAASRAAQTTFTQQAPGFWESLGNRFREVAGDPQTAAQLTMAAAGALAPPTGLTADQQALLAEQREELARLREQDVGSYNARMAAAQSVLQEARGIDPEAEARVAQARTMQNVGRSQRERAREAALSPNRAGMDISLQARQNEILGQQAAETAYQSGFESARRQRAGLMQSGAGLLPSGAYTSSFTAGSALLGDYGSVDDRRNEDLEYSGRGIGSFSNLFGGG